MGWFSKSPEDEWKGFKEVALARRKALAEIAKYLTSPVMGAQQAKISEQMKILNKYKKDVPPLLENIYPKQVEGLEEAIAAGDRKAMTEIVRALNGRDTEIIERSGSKRLDEAA
jgi:hypothetical protein